MPASTLAGIITATGTVFTAVALVITAVAGLIRAKRVEGKVDTVHLIVNQQHTDSMNYQRALVGALRKAGIDVPEDQSVDNTQG
jgi:Na+-transporting NADH:ubiquinone oxidoreductase subunit NqrF